VREAAENLPEPSIAAEITEVELDEMWHFIKAKKTNFGLSKQLTVVQGEPTAKTLQVIVMLKQSNGFTRNLPI